jgi:NAD(P)-dependent dehydrogenase (short-subunit alcohol dehydrogenase family)
MTYDRVAADLTGRTALVTGANRGMGKETARELVRMGADVVLACRSKARGDEAAGDINETTGRTGATAMELDLSSLGSVRQFASSFMAQSPALDVLVNNAAASLRTRQVTDEGFERTWATNVLGPYALTTLLLPALGEGGRGRIVTVSTVAARGLDLSDTQYTRRRFNGVGAYLASKQAARMLTWALADRLANTTTTANALNPAYVLTDLTKNVGGVMKLLVAATSFRAKSPLEGADTAIWLSASDEVAGESGKFWNKRHERRCRFRDADARAELVALVEQQIGEAA